MGGIILFDGVCNFVIALFNLSSNMIKLAIFNLHRCKARLVNRFSLNIIYQRI